MCLCHQLFCFCSHIFINWLTMMSILTGGKHIYLGYLKNMWMVVAHSCSLVYHASKLRKVEKTYFLKIFLGGGGVLIFFFLLYGVGKNFRGGKKLIKLVYFLPEVSFVQKTIEFASFTTTNKWVAVTVAPNNAEPSSQVNVGVVSKKKKKKWWGQKQKQ